ncbi:BTAD domain-containing putative transcriptional regulator [Micromonospora sp. NPDC050417]|uniref:BTAD domain-containing putative transcriptional regulator n=1 Tax=Micromonospora sp. NPDC050417 TaxID=3364280 RepID=UPI00378F47C6
MGAGLRFELLGPLRAWHGDRELDLGPGKQRAVLAMLLLYAGRPVSPTQIVDAVWQDEPPMNGPNVVQKYVAGLRRVLEPERSPRSPGQLLTLTDAGYQLRVSAENLDVELFERLVRRAAVARTEERSDEAADELRRALALWQGEPLVGLNGTFFDAARTRLVEGRAAALESWAEVELGLGRHKEMVTDLIQAVGRFPVREQLHGLLMLALYRSGRQAEALAAFREVRALLREEYGVEPGENLQELHRRILRSDPTLGAAGEQERFVPPVLIAPAAAAVPFAARAVVPAAAPVTEPVTEPVPASAPVPTVLATPPGPVYPPAFAVAGPPAFAAVPMPVPMPMLPGQGTLAAETGRRTWSPWLEGGVGMVTVLVTCGLFTWLVMLYHYSQRRGRLLAATVLIYAALTALFLTWVVQLEEEEVDLTVFDVVAVTALWTIWLVGAVHALLINLWMDRSAREPTSDLAVAQRARREQARQLLQHYPAARVGLRIGRPDLLRTVDDGGLIDVNAVVDHVLWSLPGIAPEQGRQIAMERSLRGGFVSFEDFAARSALPPTVLDSLRDLLLFLPPPTPGH